MIRAAGFDVGECLVNEAREYGTWADWLGVPRHTFSAVFGAVIAQGRDYQETFEVFRPGFEADVKRWVLTHKHPDLKAAFERQRAAANGIPTAYQSLAAKATDLEAANQRLRAQNSELRQRVDTYVQVIDQLGTQLRQERATPPVTGDLHPLRRGAH